MELTDFSVWLRDGGRLFRGGGGIAIVVRAQGGVLGEDLHEVFVGEVGVLQGTRDRSGVATVRGGLIAGLLDFFVWLEGCCLFIGGGEFGVDDCADFFSWARIFVGSSSVGLGSFRAWEVAMGKQSEGEASLWGFRIFLIGVVRDGFARSGGFFVCFRESL